MTEPVTGDPVDLDRIADALEGGGQALRSRNEHLAAMSEAITALVKSTDALIKHIKAENHTSALFRWLLGALTVIAVAGITACVVLVIRLNSIANDNHSTNDLIASCVTPGGRCYDDSQARTGAAVGVLERQFTVDTAAAAWCAREPGPRTYTQIVACVTAHAGH